MTSANRSRCGTTKPTTSDPTGSNSGVFSRTAEACRFGGAEPGSPARGQHSQPVRAATQAQQNDKAMKLMREVYDPEWSKARRAVKDLQQAANSRVDRQSAELTTLTIHTIRTSKHAISCHDIAIQAACNLKGVAL